MKQSRNKQRSCVILKDRVFRWFKFFCQIAFNIFKNIWEIRLVAKVEKQYKQSTLALLGNVVEDPNLVVS